MEVTFHRKHSQFCRFSTSPRYKRFSLEIRIPDAPPNSVKFPLLLCLYQNLRKKWWKPVISSLLQGLVASMIFVLRFKTHCLCSMQWVLETSRQLRQNFHIRALKCKTCSILQSIREEEVSNLIWSIASNAGSPIKLLFASIILMLWVYCFLHIMYIVY